MTDKQRLALAALGAADRLYRQADAHRTELVELCRSLGIPTSEIAKALGIEH